MNIFDLLKQDHDKVEQIFDNLLTLELTTTQAANTQQQLFNQLKTELEVHIQIEEEVLYPLLQQIEETRDLVVEGYQEHQGVKDLLQQLVSLPKDKEQWVDKLSLLKESVEHHVEEEEYEMFPTAQKVLSQTQIQTLTKQYLTKKKQFVATARA